MQDVPPAPQGPQTGPQGAQTGPMFPPYVTQPIQPMQSTPYPPQQPPLYAPPQPPYPSLYPAPQPVNVYFQNQSFTNKAVIAFLLYWLGYVPGLIFNVMFLIEAHRVEGETGRTPSGYGCLWATLIGSLLPAALFVGLCFFLFLAMAASGAGGGN